MHFMIEQNLLFRLRQLLKPYLQSILSTATFCKSEAQKVLDDDSSKILLFFTSSVFSLSEHNMTLSHSYTVTELQLLQKGVVKSWLGPLNYSRFWYYLAHILSHRQNFSTPHITFLSLGVWYTHAKFQLKIYSQSRVLHYT